MIDAETVAWLTFEVRCEEHDRGLPGAPSAHDPDCWMPAPGWPWSESQRHAREALREVRQRFGVPMSRQSAAHHAVIRMSHAERIALLARVAPEAMVSDADERT